MKEYVFPPCRDERHPDCGFLISFRDNGSACSCTCHHSEEEFVNFEIKTKVTGVTVELTPEAVRLIWAAVKSYYVEESPAYVQWERVIKAMAEAENSE